MNIVCNGRVNNPAPGTPVRLSNNPSVTASRLLFQVIPGLTGKTYVGTPGMIKATLAGVARILLPNTSGGSSETFSIEAQDGTDSIRLCDYAIDTDVTGEGLLISYWQE